ncbi:hypothetical protein V8D89_009572 [Ganoderma adspersum]
MSAHVTQKRSRSKHEGEDLPPPKRESDHNDSVSVEGNASAGSGQGPGEQEAASDGGQAFNNDKEFWFEDGMVIFISRNTKFRVYKGVLAKLSTVFEALFVDPSHAVHNVSIDEEQTISCPIVHISDTPQDMQCLFRVCFFSKRLGSLYENQELSYHEISAGIRLGEKYKITEWYSQSLKYLKCWFPSTLDAWTALDSYGPLSWGPKSGIGAITLGRKTGDLSFLLSAFISCICMQCDSPATSEYLSPNDLNLCLNGKTSLRAATVTAVFRIFEPKPSAGCKTSSACKQVLRDVLLLLWNDIGELLRCNPFTGYDTYVPNTGLRVCKSCTTMVKERDRKECQDVWNRLPEFLSIEVPGWAAK